MAIALCVIISPLPLAGAVENQNNSNNIGSDNAITNQNVTTNKEEIAQLQDWLNERNFNANISDNNSTISNLTPGGTGKNVVALQKWLKIYNFYNGEIDGQFDNATEQAVKRFQNASGITEDGWVGIQTLQAMKQWENNKQGNNSENTQNTDSSTVSPDNSSKTVPNNDQSTVPKSSDRYSTKNYHTTHEHSIPSSYCVGKGTGDCWVNSDNLYNQLTSTGEQARIIQYGTSLSPRHRSVQIYQNGGWVDYNYKANGYAKRYYATKNKPGEHVVK